MQAIGDLLARMLAISFAELLDIGLVSAMIFGLLYVVRGTRAIQLLRGILLLVLFAFLVNQVLPLQAFKGIVTAILPAILVSIPVIFQPELRRSFERLGRSGIFSLREGVGLDSGVANQVSRAARRLSDERHGALIVIERRTSLDEILESGVSLDAALTDDLLVQIFYPKSPLHDGAVVIRGGRILAAKVVLPLGEPNAQVRRLGTRHLAALSITRTADVVTVVVSEETGTISLAEDGRLVRGLDQGALAKRLNQAFAGDEVQKGLVREELMPVINALGGRRGFHLPPSDRASLEPAAGFAGAE